MTNKTETELRLDAWAALSALEKPLQDFKRTRKYLLNKSHLGLKKKQEDLKKEWEELEDNIKAEYSNDFIEFFIYNEEKPVSEEELDNLWRSYSSKMSNSFNEKDFKHWFRIVDYTQRNKQIESKIFNLHIQRAAEDGIKDKEQKIPPRPILKNRYDIKYHKNNKNKSFKQ